MIYHVPGPSKAQRICNRYTAGGSSCLNVTLRADGWCGECEGFTAPANRPDQSNMKRDWMRIDEIPLDAEDLAELVVTRATIRSFCLKHNCTPAEADSQIMSMVEDFLLSDKTQASQNQETGEWRMRNHGYSVYLSADKGAVTGYFTHRSEETWGQVKSAGPDRSSSDQLRMDGTCRRDRAWFLDMQSTSGLKVGISRKAASTYIRFAKGEKLTRESAKRYLPEITREVNGAVTRWDGTDGRHELRDPNDPDTFWILVKRPEEEAKVLGFYAGGQTVSRSKQENFEPADPRPV